MKVILNLCIVCLIVAFVGCETTEDASSSIVSPSANLGAVDDAPSCSGAATSCTADKADASLGAVGDKADKKCCGSCDKSDASLGAVSDSKSCSGAVKSSCSSSKSDASLGAVSDKPSHCSGSGPCPFAGKKSDG